MTLLIVTTTFSATEYFAGAKFLSTHSFTDSVDAEKVVVTMSIVVTSK